MPPLYFFKVRFSFHRFFKPFGDAPTGFFYFRFLSFPCVPFRCSVFLPRSVRFPLISCLLKNSRKLHRFSHLGSHNLLRGRPPLTSGGAVSFRYSNRPERTANRRHASGGDLLNARTPRAEGRKSWRSP